MKKVTEEEARDLAQKLYRYDNIAADRVPTLQDVGENEIRFYKEQGFLIVDSVLTNEEIERALQEIDDIIHGRLKGPKVQIVKPEEEIKTAEDRVFATRKVYDYVDYAPTLTGIANHEGILSVVERLLGDKPKLVGNQGLLKPPFGGAEKPWHQDMAYGGLFFKKQILGVWIALDEAGIDNGCMHIIPKSHMDGGTPHYMVRDWQICDSSIMVDRDVAVPLKPGGILIFSGLLHHGTPANFSSRRRQALQLRFAPASSVLMSKEEFKLMFTNEMTDAEC